MKSRPHIHNSNITVIISRTKNTIVAMNPTQLAQIIKNFLVLKTKTAETVKLLDFDQLISIQFNNLDYRTNKVYRLNEVSW
jgi:1-deoxy-D-xylulose 5-phosphate reductoisomerase